MLVTFVIGLREGLEAALIVGIVAGFLVHRGERKALKAMWVGVATAILISVGVAVALALTNRSLSFRAREVMEASLALLAVAGVTYMIVWMRRNAPGLRTELESRAGSALASGSTWAIVGMAFVAVIREGIETAIFVLAASSQASDSGLALTGALAGIGAALLPGIAFYKGSLNVDLARFFKFTSVVLVVVAAGLVAGAAHDLGEAQVLTVLQGSAVNLSSIISPGTIRASLVTGLLGLQPVPTWAELVGWVLFAAALLTYIFWPGSVSRSRVATTA